jgi:hypothetical protein
MKIILALVFLILTSCQNMAKKDKYIQDSSALSFELNQLKNRYDLELMEDSTKIGVKGKFKIHIEHYHDRIDGGAFVRMLFYERQDSSWKNVQDFLFEKNGITGADPKIDDFNNDGINDLMIRAGYAARGSNVLNYLYLFDQKEGRLRLIKNSSDFPNLSFNKLMNCFDAFRVYAGCSTEYLHLINDSLIIFEGIDVIQGIREKYIIDANGQRRVIKRDSIDTDYVRYNNFETLETNTRF